MQVGTKRGGGGGAEPNETIIWWIVCVFFSENCVIHYPTPKSIENCRRSAKKHDFFACGALRQKQSKKGIDWAYNSKK